MEQCLLEREAAQSRAAREPRSPEFQPFVKRQRLGSQCTDEALGMPSPGQDPFTFLVSDSLCTPQRTSSEPREEEQETGPLSPIRSYVSAKPVSKAAGYGAAVVQLFSNKENVWVRKHHRRTAMDVLDLQEMGGNDSGEELESVGEEDHLSQMRDHGRERV